MPESGMSSVNLATLDRYLLFSSLINRFLHFIFLPSKCVRLLFSLRSAFFYGRVYILIRCFADDKQILTALAAGF